MGRERRRRNRVRTGTANAAVSAATTGAAPGTPHSDPVRTGQMRTDRVIERESKMMIDESKRVVWVSAICFGMLAMLVVIDRIQ